LKGGGRNLFKDTTEPSLAEIYRNVASWSRQQAVEWVCEIGTSLSASTIKRRRKEAVVVMWYHDECENEDAASYGAFSHLIKEFSKRY
jgi:hypothetical protein